MKYFFLAFLIISLSAKAQQTKLPLSLSLFNNGTSLPGTGYAGIFSKMLHPGITLGTYYIYHKKEKSEIFQTLKLGYFYHRHAQQGIQLYTEVGYRYLMKSGFYGEGLLGMGYLHSFADIQQFQWEEGKYVQKTNWGRPQFMATASLAVGYDVGIKSKLPLRLFLQYQFWLQAPFVNKYVPLLPNTALHIGIVYQLPFHHLTTIK